jgi:phytoene dehydrogenase-like protein
MKNITIIGAGLGGLTAGALLAKQGHKVTVLEQHTIVGGCATTFKRKGFTCEVGLHEMNAVYTNPTTRMIFETLGVYDHIEFVRPEEFFRVTTEALDFTMPDDVDQAQKKLIDHYPNDAHAIHTYFALLRSLAQTLEKLSLSQWFSLLASPLKLYQLWKYQSKSVKVVLDEIFSNDALKIILNANMGYYSDNVHRLSFLLHAVAQYSYYTGGGWFIQGGSQKLSDYLASVIRDHGGTIITKANATQIDPHQKEVTYLHHKECKHIRYDRLIANISPQQTYAMAGVAYHEKFETSESLLSIYIGFHTNLKSVYGKRPYSNFMLKTVKNLDELHESLHQKRSKRGFVFVDYSQIDAQLCPPEKSFGALCATDYVSDWEALSPQQYEAQKAQLLESFLDELERHYPHIREYIEFAEVGTAKTMQRYLKTPNGTVYGFAPTTHQFFRRPQIQSPLINDLYFVGQWVVGGGFSPAIASGKMGMEHCV